MFDPVSGSTSATRAIAKREVRDEGSIRYIDSVFWKWLSKEETGCLVETWSHAMSGFF